MTGAGVQRSHAKNHGAERALSPVRWPPHGRPAGAAVLAASTRATSHAAAASPPVDRLIHGSPDDV